MRRTLAPVQWEQAVKRELREVLTEWCRAYNDYFAGRNDGEAVFARLSQSFESQYGVPRVGPDLFRLKREQEVAETREMAAHYQAMGGAPWAMVGLKVLPRTPGEAIVSYEIRQLGPILFNRAISLEVWRREADGEWRVVRQVMEQMGGTQTGA